MGERRRQERGDGGRGGRNGRGKRRRDHREDTGGHTRTGLTNSRLYERSRECCGGLGGMCRSMEQDSARMTSW